MCPSRHGIEETMTLREHILERTALAAFVLSVIACDAKPKVDLAGAAAQSPPASTNSLDVDAGLFLEPSDPPPPAGDLKSDLERFVNINACIKERANLDPLVGDGLRALGYDTFLRDACRLLEATKDKKLETCDRIDASSMRARCQSWVAMVSETPDACPLKFEGVAIHGRRGTCLAVAAKDARLCASEANTAERATCEALAARDESRCDGLGAEQRPSCKREFQRWRSLLSPPLTGLPALPKARGKLVLKGESGTADPVVSETDLSSEFAQGGVVVTARNRSRIELGMIGASEMARIAPSPHQRARFGLTVLLEPGASSKDPPKPSLERLELEIPGEATLVHPGANCDCRFTTARIDRSRGGEVALAMQGSIGAGSRRYRIDVDIVTFVRDIVDEQKIGVGRVLAPVHPNVTTRTAPTTSATR